MTRLITLVLILISLTILQSWGFSILGVKPNMALAALIASAFFIFNIWEGFFLIALAAFILKFSPAVDTSIVIFSLIAAVLISAAKYLPWQSFFSNIILIALGTSIFYGLLARDLLMSLIFLKEFGLNILIGALIFALMSNLWDNKS